MGRFSSFAATAAVVAMTGVVAQEEFNILQHIGGNGQWFPGKSSYTMNRIHRKTV